MKVDERPSQAIKKAVCDKMEAWFLDIHSSLPCTAPKGTAPLQVACEHGKPLSSTTDKDQGACSIFEAKLFYEVPHQEKSVRRKAKGQDAFPKTWGNLAFGL